MRIPKILLTTLLSVIVLSIHAQYWQPSGLNTYFTGGNVGIGTTTPTNPLTVVTPADEMAYFKNPSTANVRIIVANNTGQMNLGIGATTPHPYVWSNTNSFFIGSDGNPTLFVSGMGNGNVGIGTSTPDSKLQVAGNADIGDGYDPTKYGILQLVRPANQGDNKFHISFVRNGNSVSGMGYAPNSNVLGIWHSNNNQGIPTMAFTYDQKVGIGTINTNEVGFKLFVETGIRTRKVKVDQNTWSDYVFYSNYRLRPLSEVEQYIKQYGHLPEVPSAEEVEKNGLDVGDNQVTLLKKIEELTLYVIEQNKKIQALEIDVKSMKGKRK